MHLALKRWSFMQHHLCYGIFAVIELMMLIFIAVNGSEYIMRIMIYPPQRHGMRCVFCCGILRNTAAGFFDYLAILNLDIDHF